MLELSAVVTRLYEEAKAKEKEDFRRNPPDEASADLQRRFHHYTYNFHYRAHCTLELPHYCGFEHPLYWDWLRVNATMRIPSVYWFPPSRPYPPILEKKMMELASWIRSKPDWARQVQDKVMRGKWREEGEYSQTVRWEHLGSACAHYCYTASPPHTHTHTQCHPRTLACARARP
jgi:hypothetical protein